jgi:primosomal protein N' (replication factor Y)
MTSSPTGTPTGTVLFAARYAEVAVPLHVRQTYTYRLPGVLAERAQPGCRVLVPVRNKIVTGYVVAIHDEPGEGLESTTIRDVEELVDEEPIVTEEILRLTHWVADYYYAPWGECLKSALPAGLAASSEIYLTIAEAGRTALASVTGRRAESAIMRALARVAEAGTIRARDLGEEVSPARANALARELERKGLVRVEHRVGEQRVQPKRRNVVRLVAAPASDGKERETDAQRRVVAELEARGGEMTLSALVEAAAVSASVVRTLERHGRVEVTAEEVRRDPLAHVEIPEAERFEPTPGQRAALELIHAAVDAGGYRAFLLHGVTGSGKTEVYIRAMRAAIERGRSALMLVPEINLTPVFSRRLAAHFGEAVAILHSSLSDGERLDEWRRIRRGEARVVIGTRSAVFAPLENVGVIVVDEEHEGSYKQDATPRYSGRDTAVFRAHQAGAVVILGSATPSMESYHNAHSGKYDYVRLDARVNDRPLAEVQIVDMREVFTRFGKQQTFAPELLDAVSAAHGRGEQSIVLLNRRGFSAFLLCRSCGYSIQCPNCDVTLTYHKSQARLVCHYCNHQTGIPQSCPECAGAFIYYVGEGTEQIEAKLKEHFPELRIARLDRDTASRRGAYERILGEFASGGLDLLVGTQMVAKGHDFPNVTLVGVVSVDAGMAMPDFRSAERSFQLLTQVAGRAGRGDAPGTVLIQTYHPEHYALVHARNQDYEGFYEHEIRFRRSMSYPPFTTLINCLVQDEDLTKAKTHALDLSRALLTAAAGRELRVLGPAPAPIARIKNKHRWQVLVKARSRPNARDALDIALGILEENGVPLKTISIEVDPVNLM